MIWLKINKYAWYDIHTHQNQIQNISVWWMLDREGNCYLDYDIQLVQGSIMFQVNASDHIHIPICKCRKMTDIAWCRLMLCEFDTTVSDTICTNVVFPPSLWYLPWYVENFKNSIGVCFIINKSNITILISLLILKQKHQQA